MYSALGSRISVVELTEQLIPSATPISKPLQKHIAERYEAIMLSTKVASAETGRRDRGHVRGFRRTGSPDV